MYAAAFLLVLAAGSHAKLVVTTVTGKTPPPIDCPNKLCTGKTDGNFALPGKPNHFLQCVHGLAYCQACWPSNLVFVEKCNMCLYTHHDECPTTKPWVAPSTFDCPNMCPGKPGSHKKPYTGNMGDPHNSWHFVSCHKGKTVGCIACPSGLQYNEESDACLWNGVWVTDKPKH